MSGLLRISEAAVLAVHTVAILGANPGRIQTTKEIAAFLKASEAHLSKVLQRLVRTGMVASVRGPSGGFLLVDGAMDRPVMDVYEAIDGVFPEAGCLLSAPVCGGDCVLGPMLETVHDMVRGRFQELKISDIADRLKIGADSEKTDNQN